MAALLQSYKNVILVFSLAGTAFFQAIEIFGLIRRAVFLFYFLVLVYIKSLIANIAQTTINLQK